jgi:hypothetical protein
MSQFTPIPSEALLSSILQSIRKVRADLNDLEGQYHELKAILMPLADANLDCEAWETPEEKAQRIASQGDEEEDDETLWFTPPPKTNARKNPSVIEEDEWGEGW